MNKHAEIIPRSETWQPDEVRDAQKYTVTKSTRNAIELPLRLIISSNCPVLIDKRMKEKINKEINIPDHLSRLLIFQRDQDLDGSNL